MLEGWPLLSQVCLTPDPLLSLPHCLKALGVSREIYSQVLQPFN
jgi:predicted DNA-binding transcriptional regulator AlpA